MEPEILEPAQVKLKSLLEEGTWEGGEDMEEPRREMELADTIPNQTLQPSAPIELLLGG